MKVQVRKRGLDWAVVCHEHHELAWCGSWADAYEIAAGHCVMHHPAPAMEPLIKGCSCGQDHDTMPYDTDEFGRFPLVCVKHKRHYPCRPCLRGDT